MLTTREKLWLEKANDHVQHNAHVIEYIETQIWMEEIRDFDDWLELELAKEDPDLSDLPIVRLVLIETPIEHMMGLPKLIEGDKPLIDLSDLEALLRV